MAAKTIAEVIDQLDNIIAQSIAENKRIGYFAALYKKVTVAVADKIKQGYFDDNVRMEKLDVIFANRYLDAYECYSQNKSCSASWQLSFDACNTWSPMVFHHLLSGMNAHIGLDLGMAAAVVSQGAPLENMHNDFNKINIILSSLVNDIKTDLYNMWPLSKFIIKLNTGKLENEVAGFSMNIARDAAWQVALNYTACNGTEAEQNYLSLRDKSVAGFSDKLLHPGRFMQIVTGIFRVFELGTIPNKIRRLND